MLAAIQLNDQLLTKAGEVDDESTAWHLAFELVTFELSVAQTGPESLLCRRLI